MFPRLSLSGAAALLLSASLLGCQNKSKSAPFADVTDRNRAEATDAPIAPQTPPPEPSEAARMERPATIPGPADAARTAQLERDVRQAPIPVDDRSASALPMTDAVADRTGRPTTQGSIPIRIDDLGGARRDWTSTVAYRPSGNVIAGPTYWREHELISRRPGRPGRDEWKYGLVEPVEFLVNTVLLPVRAILTPPNREVVYSEAENVETSPAAVNPSMNGSPQAPPNPEP